MDGVTYTSKQISQDYLLVIVRGLIDELIVEHDDQTKADLKWRILDLLKTRKHWGFLVRSIRERDLNMSSTAFAKRLGYSDAFQCQIEMGKALPTNIVVKVIAKELNFPPQKTALTVQNIRDLEEAKQRHLMHEYMSTEEVVAALLQEARPYLDDEYKVKTASRGGHFRSEEEIREHLASLLLGLSKNLAEGHLPLHLGEETVSKIEQLFSDTGITRDRANAHRGLAKVNVHGGGS